MTSKVRQMDRMAFLATFPDKYFDLAVDDPPYFSGPEKRGFYGSAQSKINIKRSYDITEQWEVPGADYFTELKRVSKHQIIFGVSYYDVKFDGPGRIIWDKCNGESSFSCAELAYCSMHDSVRMFRYMWNGMMQGKSIAEGHIMQGNKKLNEKRIHPTQKPVALYKWLFSKYAKVGQRIVSCHVGSGSDRIAAYDARLNFYGCELSTIHYQNQERRFINHIKQLQLFMPEPCGLQTEII